MDDNNSIIAYFLSFLSSWISSLLLILLIVVPIIFHFRSQYRGHKATKNVRHRTIEVQTEIEGSTPPTSSQVPDQLTTSNILEVLENVWEARQRWYNIGIQLKLKISDLDVIRQPGNQSADECVVEMLKFWLRRGGATWEALIDALKHKTVGYPILANQIATVGTLAADRSEGHVPTNKWIELSSKPGSKFKCPKCGNCSFKEYLEGNCPKFKSDSAFPYLDMANLTENERLTLQVQLRKETKTIITDFANLVFHMRESFKHNNIDPRDVATTALGTATCESSTVALMETLDVKNLDSVDILMGHLQQNRYISFLNYHIVQDLINKYGTDKDKEEFSEYETKFKNFCKRSVFEIPTYIFGTVPSDGEILAFKITSEMLDNLRSSNSLSNDSLSPTPPTTRQKMSSETLHLSLESTLSIQMKVAEALGLLDSVWKLVFVSAYRGCIELTFSIPRPILDTLKPQLKLHSEFSISKQGFIELESSGIHILCGPPGKPCTTTIAIDCVAFQWTKPEFEGFYPLQYYFILYRSVMYPPTRWRILQTKCPTEKWEIKQLPQNRSPFLFKVQAVNDIGAGLQSESSDPVDLVKPSESKKSSWNTNIPSKPGKPRAFNATHDTIHLEWTKPALGADSVTSYTMLYRSNYDRPNHWMEQKAIAIKEEAVVSQLSEKTTYVFLVEPECGAGVGLESDISEPITTKMLIPSKPGKPMDTNVTHNSIQLEWTKPEQGAHNIMSYAILYCSTSDPPDQWTEHKEKTTMENLTVSELSEYTLYFFKIRPECEVGIGLESDISDPIQTKMIIPSKPGKPKASNVTHDSIQLEWTKPEQGAHNISSYTIFYRSISDPPDSWCEYKAVTNEEVLLPQLSENVMYYFKIRPECKAGVGLESDISDPIKTNIIIPSKPGQPKALTITHNSIQLEWTKPEQGAHNITSYTTLYHPKNDSPEYQEWMEQKVDTVEEKVIMSQLLESTIYFFKIQPNCGNILGLESDTSEPFKTKMILPSKPGQPKALNITHDSIELEWTKPEQGAHNVASYTVFICTINESSDSLWKQEVETADEFVNISHLSEKTIYFFKVLPNCDEGCGLESDISGPIMTTVIPPSKPGKPRATNITHDSIELEWTKPEQGANNVMFYNVLYRFDSGQWNEQIMTSNDAKVIMSQLKEHTIYFFKIRPECETKIDPGILIEGEISEPIKTKMIIPSKPSKPRALKVTHNSIQLEWTKPEQGAHNITSYTVLYHSKKDSPEYQEWTEQKVDTVKEKVIVSQLLEKTVYFFKVQPRCGDVLGLESDVSEPLKTEMIVPGKPGKANPTKVTHDSIELEWTKPEQGAHNVISYTVFICTVNESSDNLWKQEAETVDELVNISHLSEKTIYCFKVQPNYDEGCGLESDISGPIMTTVIPPSKPGKPRATNITHDSIELEWTKPELGAHNVTSYTVLYRLDSGQWNEQITTSNDAKVIMSQLKEHSIYFFKIRPECETKHDPGILIEGEISEPIKTKMIIPGKPSKPRAFNVTHNSIQLEWTKPEQGAHNITSYTILYHSKNDSPEYQEWTEQKVDTVKEKVIVSQLLEKTVYFFKVQPRCGDVLGLESDVSEPLKTEMIVPGKPGKPNPTKVTHDSIELEWTKPEQGAHNVISYTVFICTVNESSDNLWKQEAETVDELVNISHLSEKTIYCFKVQPNYDEGCGWESDISGPMMTKVIPPSKPGKPRATNITHDSIELEWTKPEQGANNVTSYTVLYYSNSDPPYKWKEHKALITDEMAVVSKLSEKTSYIFKILPECASGFGLESDVSESIMTKMIAPSNPGTPEASSITHNSIQLEWRKPEQGAHNIRNYTVFYRSSSDPPECWMKTVTVDCEESVLVTNLLEDTSYYFKIRPEYEGDVGIESEVSDAIKTKISPGIKIDALK